MRTPVSIAAVAFITAAGLLYSGSVPTNDTVAGATPISALPFTATLDTTQATTDATDASLNANCGAPATEASVWYYLRQQSFAEIANMYESANRIADGAALMTKTTVDHELVGAAAPQHFNKPMAEAITTAASALPGRY